MSTMSSQGGFCRESTATRMMPFSGPILANVTDDT